MKKLHMTGLVVAAMFAFSAFAASAAFAVEVPQWLVNGATIALGTEVDADLFTEAASGLVLIEDMNASGKPDLLCEITKSLGFLLSNGEGTIVEGECPAPVVDSGTCGSPVVRPVNLPWTTLVLEPEVNVFEIDITAGTGGSPGWLAECTVLGIKIDDVCTTTNGKALLNNLADGLVEVDFMETVPVTEQANCTVGGNEQGLVVGLAFIHALNAAGELQTLAVSLANEVA